MPRPALGWDATETNQIVVESISFTQIKDDFDSYEPHRLSDYYGADVQGWQDPDRPVGQIDLTAGSNVTWTGTGSASGNSYNAVWYGGSPMTYGAQNFGVYNDNIEAVWSDGYYNSRDFAPACAVLQNRYASMSYQYSNNNWESAWWLSGSGHHTIDILVVKLADGYNCSSINVRNNTQTCGNTSGGILSVWIDLESNGNNITGATLGGTHTLNSSSEFGTTTFSSSQQYLMFTRSGASGWSRLERIELN